MTPKRARFVEEYLVDLNATQAAIRAGYSEKTAHSQGPRLLENVEVAAAIEKAKQARSERTEITQDEVLRALAQMAFSNMEDYATWGAAGVVIGESTGLSRDQAGAVQEVSEHPTKYGKVLKFKLHDRCPALNLLGKHLGMFPDRLAHSVEDNSVEALAKLLGVKPEDLPE